jgi:hypothetical protein
VAGDTNGYDVLVQLFLTVGAVGAVAIPLWFSQRRRIGKPNGNGNVIEMLTKILRWQWLHEQKDDNTRRDVRLIAEHIGLELPEHAEDPGFGEPSP